MSVLLPDDIRISIMKEWIENSDLLNYDIATKRYSNDQIYRMNYFKLDNEITLRNNNTKWLLSNKIKTTNLFIDRENEQIEEYIKQNGSSVIKMKIFHKDGRVNFILENCPSIKHLELSACFNLVKIDNFNLNLIFLSVDVYHLEIGTFVNIIKKSPLLEYLRIVRFYQFDLISINLSVSDFPKLTDLNISSKDLSGKHFEPFVSLNILKYLNLSSIRNLSDEILIRFSTNLISLEISYCKKITDLGLINMSKKCPNLTKLDISNCENITDVSIIELSKNCLSLKHLDLRSCFGLTGTSNIIFPNLEYLNVMYLHYPLSLIVKNCPLITHLSFDYGNINNIEIINNNEISEMIYTIGKLKFLKKLDLEINGTLIEESLTLLTESFDFLNFLAVYRGDLDDEILFKIVNKSNITSLVIYSSGKSRVFGVGRCCVGKCWVHFC